MHCRIGRPDSTEQKLAPVGAARIPGFDTRRDGRVVECTGFEIRRTVFAVPRVRIPLSPPASLKPLQRRGFFVGRTRGLMRGCEGLGDLSQLSKVPGVALSGGPRGVFSQTRDSVDPGRAGSPHLPAMRSIARVTDSSAAQPCTGQSVNPLPWATGRARALSIGSAPMSALQRKQPLDTLIASACDQPGAAATDRFPTAAGCLLHQRSLVMPPAATP